MQNTKHGGTIRFFIYKEGKKYVGVCLDLDIVEEGKDIEKLKESLGEAARGYVETIIKEEMNESLLNQHAPKKYWEKYRSYLKYLEKEKLSENNTSHLHEASISSVCLPNMLRRNWTVV